MKSFNIRALNHNGELCIITNRFKLQVKNILTNQILYECQRNPEMAYPIFLEGKTMFYFTTSEGYIEIHDYENQKVIHKRKYGADFGYPLIFDTSNNLLIMWLGFSKELIVYDMCAFEIRYTLRLSNLAILTMNKNPDKENSYLVVTKDFSNEKTTQIRVIELGNKITVDLLHESNNIWFSHIFDCINRSYYFIDSKEVEPVVHRLEITNWIESKTPIKGLKVGTNWHLKLVNLINEHDMLLTVRDNEGSKTGIYYTDENYFKEINKVYGSVASISDTGDLIALNYEPNKNKLLKRIENDYTEIVIRNGEFIWI